MGPRPHDLSILPVTSGDLEIEKKPGREARKSARRATPARAGQLPPWRASPCPCRANQARQRAKKTPAPGRAKGGSETAATETMQAPRPAGRPLTDREIAQCLAWKKAAETGPQNPRSLPPGTEREADTESAPATGRQKKRPAGGEPPAPG